MIIAQAVCQQNWNYPSCSAFFGPPAVLMLMMVLVNYDQSCTTKMEAILS